MLTAKRWPHSARRHNPNAPRAQAIATSSISKTPHPPSFVSATWAWGLAPHGLKKSGREQESQEREERHQRAEGKESGKKSEADGTAHGPKRDPAV